MNKVTPIPPGKRGARHGSPRPAWSKLCEHVMQEHFDSDESEAVSNKGLALLGGDETVTQ